MITIVYIKLHISSKHSVALVNIFHLNLSEINVHLPICFLQCMSIFFCFENQYKRNKKLFLKILSFIYYLDISCKFFMAFWVRQERKCFSFFFSEVEHFSIERKPIPFMSRAFSPSKLTFLIFLLKFEKCIHLPFVSLKV